MFQVVCINDSDRPNEIPADRWIKKGQIYTVVQVDKLNAQGGVYGYKLEGLNIDDLAPYQYFASKRFAIPDDLPIMEDSIYVEEKMEVV